MTLTEIANSLKIDKGTNSFEAHSYTETYQQYFQHIKENNIKMLEIGVYDPRFKGGSVTLWTSYFNNLSLIGFDINSDAKVLESNNVKIFIGDQSNKDDLLKCVELYGGNFDIIIDDGLHSFTHQVTSYKTLIPFLNKEGLYIIEDLHAYDCYKTIDWFKENNIDFELFNNNKLLIHRKK